VAGIASTAPPKHAGTEKGAVEALELGGMIWDWPSTKPNPGAAIEIR
jgi:hypothetical protein